MEIKEIFDSYRSIAVYGMSANPAKPSHSVPVFFIEKGYEVHPINPAASEIAGRKVYQSLDDVPGTIDVLNVFRPSDQALSIVEEAVARKHEKGDIKLIWLQEGITSQPAEELARRNGIDFIQDKCMYREYIKLYK